MFDRGRDVLYQHHSCSNPSGAAKAEVSGLYSLFLARLERINLLPSSSLALHLEQPHWRGRILHRECLVLKVQYQQPGPQNPVVGPMVDLLFEQGPQPLSVSISFSCKMGLILLDLTG